MSPTLHKIEPVQGQEILLPANLGSLSDEDYLILKSKALQATDPYAAKAWMITAKTLFPRNFSVQLEAYTTEKNAKNVREAARYFSSLYVEFPNERELWREAQLIISAMQSNQSDSMGPFYRELFNNLSPEVQHMLIISTAEHTEDTLEHCRLIMLLLNIVPSSISVHGPKLVETLLSAEKQSRYSTPVNCYRKLLVTDVLPVLLYSKMCDIPPKQVYRLLLKSIEFYVSWLIAGKPHIEGLLDKECQVGDPWSNLFRIVSLTGWKMGWEISSHFTYETNREVLLQKLWTNFRTLPLGPEDSPTFKQILYGASVVLLEALYHYNQKINPSASDAPPLVLIRNVQAHQEHHSEPSHLPRRRKTEENPLLGIHRSVPAGQASGVVQNFLTAASCWELLHQTEELRTEFGRFCQHLRIDTWAWLPTFLLDVFIYQGLYNEALAQLHSLGPPRPQFLLKQAAILWAMSNHRGAADQIIQLVHQLPDSPSELASTPSPASSAACVFLPWDRSAVLHYSVLLMQTCFQERIARNLSTSGGDDLALGHLLVLLQHDMAKENRLLEDVLNRIKMQGSFTYPYPLFPAYVIQVDILEELLYLASEVGGNISLDIFPNTAAQALTTRRMSTRWGDKGAKEEFRAAMRRQVARSSEPIMPLLLSFLKLEKNMILQAFG